MGRTCLGCDLVRHVAVVLLQAGRRGAQLARLALQSRHGALRGSRMLLLKVCMRGQQGVSSSSGGAVTLLDAP